MNNNDKTRDNTSRETKNYSRRQILKSAVASAAIAAAPLSLANAIKPQQSDDITWLPGWKLRDMMADKKVSPVDVVEHFLRRIDKLDPLLHAYITVDHEGARAQANAAERAVMKGDSLGPLHGLPISIKDLYETKGLRTTQGSMIFKDTIPTRDAFLVERLRAAGAIIIGKTHTPEFATFPRTTSLLAGECVNPWNQQHITGASSGGSGAAVAAGISPYSIGSDGGGSTRIPACFNGVFGFQPSAGRIPGRKPHSVQMASAGPMTQYVKDAAIIIQVMSGMDPRDPSAIERPSPNFLGGLDQGIKDFRIAWSPDFGVIPIIEPKVVGLVETAANVFTHAGAHVDAPQIVFPDDEAWQVFLTINESSLHRGSRLLDFTPAQQVLLTPPTKLMLEQVKATPPMTVEQETKALELRAGISRWADNIFAKYDLICTPTTGIIAPKIPKGRWDQPYTDPYFARHISTSYTYVANILGLPAASIPCGFVDGLPVGLQIIGKRFEDVKVMRAAQSFAKRQPWMNKHPQIAL